MDNSIRGHTEIGIISLGLVCLIVAGFILFPKMMGALPEGAESFNMVAELKGSTYGPGDIMTVFGVCKDTNGKALGANAYLSARYPNGSVVFSDSVMTVADVGVFYWTGTMYSVPGTYLTSIRCEYGGRSAYAYGEWQNPLWVRQIEAGLTVSNDTNLRVQALQVDVGDLEDTLVMVNQTIVNEHNITREYIGDRHDMIDQLVMYAAEVANASVDRNNSLLYNMLLYLMMQAGYPVTGNVTAVFVEAIPAKPLYYTDWTIVSKVLDEYNRTISYPEVECYMTSNLVPTFKMTPDGDYFRGTVFIDVINNISVSVDCNRLI